jgi:hypothetical protein
MSTTEETEDIKVVRIKSEANDVIIRLVQALRHPHLVQVKIKDVNIILINKVHTEIEDIVLIAPVTLLPARVVALAALVLALPLQVLAAQVLVHLVLVQAPRLRLRPLPPLQALALLAVQEAHVITQVALAALVLALLVVHQAALQAVHPVLKRNSMSYMST